MKDRRSKNAREVTGQGVRNAPSRAHTSGSVLERSALRGRRNKKKPLSDLMYIKTKFTSNVLVKM